VVTRYEHPHRVVVAEIDELGHAGNFHYVRWMQQAAVAHSDINGWPAARYRSIGAGWVVRSHQITYLKPAFEGVRLTSLRRYEIRRDDGELLATAATDWAFMNYEKQKAVRIPAEVAAAFEVVPPDSD